MRPTARDEHEHEPRPHQRPVDPATRLTPITSMRLGAVDRREQRRLLRSIADALVGAAGA